jgi:hypothetical protein
VLRVIAAQRLVRAQRLASEGTFHTDACSNERVGARSNRAAKLEHISAFVEQREGSTFRLC